jgi:hypothetical protein
MRPPLKGFVKCNLQFLNILLRIEGFSKASADFLTILQFFDQEFMISGIDKL